MTGVREAADTAQMTTRELLDGIREALADLHEPPGTPNGEARDGCPGCEAQAMVDELIARWNA